MVPVNHPVPPEETELLVIALLASKTGWRAEEIRGEDRLLHDLGLYGDDAEEFVAELAKQFSLPLSSFDFGKYFFPESYAFWLFPRFLRRRIAAGKTPLTVESVVKSAQHGRWVQT